MFHIMRNSYMNEVRIHKHVDISVVILEGTLIKETPLFSYYFLRETPKIFYAFLVF